MYIKKKGFTYLNFISFRLLELGTWSLERAKVLQISKSITQMPYRAMLYYSFAFFLCISDTISY